MAIWNILQTFGIFYDHLVHFLRFWYHVPRKIWQPRFTAASWSVTGVDVRKNLLSSYSAVQLSLEQLIVVPRFNLAVAYGQKLNSNHVTVELWN
jgi:hypothetical protein